MSGLPFFVVLIIDLTMKCVAVGEETGVLEARCVWPL